MIVAGIGCRRHCPGEEIAALVRQCMAAAVPPVAWDPTRLTLAAPAFKRAEEGIGIAARLLVVPLRWVDENEMMAVAERCVSRSAAALRAVGHASVAEAAALAGAGHNARLLVARLVSTQATCALAEGDGP